MIKFPDRYKYTGSAVSGGMGNVYFCDDIHLARAVAVKSIQHMDEFDRLMDELSALMLMRSNHVVQIYDIIYDKGSPVGIVEEYVSGDDLFNSSYPQGSLDQYLRILWQIASGISDIHSAGVIHRDIKPNNMILDEEKVLKIFDFGLAREAAVNAETIGFKGTFYFAAPELFTHSHISFTTAIDVYAFGVVACYLADKNIPDEFGAKPPQPAPADLFSSKAINIPTELCGLLSLCLDRDPENRPSILEVRDLIARYFLKDKHQAIAVYNNKVNYLNKDNTFVALKLKSIGEIAIRYDGLRFLVVNVDGEVMMNNNPVAIGNEIPGSCVVVFGASHRPYSERASITFDISHPEVVL